MSKTSTPPPPDLSALAKRTLDLWQDQVGRMAHDPATLDLMTRTFAMMTKGAEALKDLPKDGPAAGWWPPAASAASHPSAAPAASHPSAAAAASHPSAAPAASRPAETTPDAPSPAPQPGAAAGAAPAADVSGDGNHLVAELLRRIAELEKRVDALESRPAGGPAKPARKRQPG